MRPPLFFSLPVSFSLWIRILLFSLTGMLIFHGLATAYPVYAQSAGSTTAVFTGAVTDEEGKLLSGIKVVAKDLSTNSTREAITGNDGEYLFELPPGLYELTVEVNGFEPQTAKFDISLGATIRLDFDLLAVQAEEPVETTPVAAAPAVESAEPKKADAPELKKEENIAEPAVKAEIDKSEKPVVEPPKRESDTEPPKRERDIETSKRESNIEKPKREINEARPKARASIVIDEGKTESSTNIERKRIDSLPINRRNFLDFSLTAPRVVADRVPTQGVSASSGLSFNGQNARFNNITTDGLDNNDNFSGSVRSTFSQDAVQEFQVLSDNYSIESGRAVGGVVNIVTRRGGNDFHGNLFFLNRNDETSARDVFAPFEADYKQYQFGSFLSGPVKRDKAFFFTSFERLSVKQNNFVTISDQSVLSARNLGFTLRNGPVPFSLGITSFLGRVDAFLSPSDTVGVRYNFGGTYNGALEPFGGLIGETNGGVQRLDDNTAVVTNNYTNSRLKLINETRFLYSRRDQNVLPLDGGPQVKIAAPEGLITFGRGTFLPQPREARTYQIVNNVSLSLNRQKLKFGVDIIRSNTPGGKTRFPAFPGGFALFLPIDFAASLGVPGLPFFTGSQAFDPSLRTPQQLAFLTQLGNMLPNLFPGFPRGVDISRLSLPVAYVQGFGKTSLEVPATFISLFVQDDIKLRSNLLLKAGLRYDLNRVRFMPDNNGNVSPRIALAYRPTQRLKLRTSYGFFFGVPISGLSFGIQLISSGALKVPLVPLPFSIIPFSQPGHHLPDSEQFPSGIPFIPQLSQSFIYEPNIRNSYSEQSSFGIDYSLGNSTTLSATYIFVRGIKLVSGRNINPIVRPIQNDPVTSAISGRIDPSRGDVFQFESAFDSYYNGLTVSVNRRFTSRLGVLAHYTYSKAIDNFFDNRTDLQEVNDPLRIGEERGLSLQDVRHRFVLSGIFELSYKRNLLLRDYQLSTIISINSGRPYNLIADRDINMNGDSQIGDRPLGIGRNVGITPKFANIDLRLSRTVVIKERYRLQGIFEIFNLFNRVNISEVDRVFPLDTQGRFNLPPKENGRFIAPPDRYRNAFSPRQCQIGFKLTF